MDRWRYILVEKVEGITKVGVGWGVHFLDMSLVPENSVVISCGIGRDVSFDAELIREKNCIVVGIDPTNLSEKWINATKKDDAHFNSNFKLIKKALYGETDKALRIGSRAWSLLAKESESFYEVQPITLKEVLEEYPNPSVLKLDIEGSEYPVFDSIDELTIPQITVEFHHWLGDVEDWSHGQCNNPYTIDDTKQCIKKLENMGYRVAASEDSPPIREIVEVLFIRNDL